jgi:hypothetical protein
MTGTNCDLFTHNQSRSYLNHLVYTVPLKVGVSRTASFNARLESMEFKITAVREAQAYMRFNIKYA